MSIRLPNMRSVTIWCVLNEWRPTTLLPADDKQVGGMEAHQARLDVEQAKAVGLDAFALNIISTEWWSTDTLRWLFEAAREMDFKLFFSFDMNHFSHPSQFLPLLKQYHEHSAYFRYRELPFVSAWILLLFFLSFD